jgi:hypothetical protein
MTIKKKHTPRSMPQAWAAMAAATLFLFAGAASAGSTSWSYSSADYVANGHYVPLSGSFTEGTFGGYQYWSRVSFSFTSHNRAYILDYNNGGDNPGKTACDNFNAYVTLDMAAVPNNSLDLEISAVEIYTNLPNAKLDYETDGGVDNEESEVVALGTVSTNIAYYMRTYWNDYRDGDTNDGGKIQAQFAMSKPGWSDYNNCILAGNVQIINNYGKNFGSM